MDKKRIIKEANRNKFLAGLLNESLDMSNDTTKPERIYLNRDLSDYFDIPYAKNDGVETFINANTLKNKHNWDSEHLNIFDKYAGQDLTLKGDGFGWWIIVRGLRENFEVTEFKFKVKHDNGFKKLKTKASSLEAAKKIIMNAEGCPEGALELISEMKKTYGQDGKASKSKYNKHLRPDGKKLANAATRKAGKEISKNAEKEIDESFVRKMIKKAINETMLKESIGVGDTVMNNGNFYKVIGEPFTATDNGAAQYAADNDGAGIPSDIDYRSFYTAIRVKNIDTGNETTGAISNFKKINPEDIEGLKQAKIAQDAADKIQKEKDDADRKAWHDKYMADITARENERISSTGDIELVNKMITDWDNITDEYGYAVNSHDELEVDCYLTLDDNLEEEYYVEFDIKYDINFSGDPEWPDAEHEFTLDLVKVYKGKDLVYKGRAEFLDIFDTAIKSWMENNEQLIEKAEETYSDWARSY